MSKIFDIIRNNISLEELFSKLNIKYTKSGTTLNLYADGKLTDGWKADLTNGIISDFSGKGRPAGDKIVFVEKYFGITRGEALSWFEDNFGIKSDNPRPTNRVNNPLRDKWNSLEELTTDQIEYLKTRAINYSLLQGIIKKNKLNIATPIRSLDNIISITGRSISSTGSRYYVEANTDSDGIFYDGIDYDKDYLFVVEGFTDYLSLRQFDTNVVGLVNAGNQQQLLYIKSLASNFKKIYFCPDNDEAGQKAKKGLDDLGVRYSLFNLQAYGVGDVNELLVNFNLGEDILDAIKIESIPPRSSLRLAFERAKEYKRLYEENGGTLGFTTGYPLIDEFTDGFIKGKTYLIMAFSNYGKTRFAYSLLRSLVKQKKKVKFYSLEVDTGMLFIELIGAIYGIEKSEVFNKLETLDIDTIEEYISIHDDIRSLEAIEKDVQNSKPDVAIIDFVQNIEHTGTEYEKLTDIAVRIQKLGILTGTIMIPLSQVGNESRFAEGSSIMPKGSGALFASSDVIFSLWGKNGNKYFTISKNKYGAAGVDLLVEPKYSISEFKLSKELPSYSTTTNTKY